LTRRPRRPAPARRLDEESPVPIDVHAHYVPPQLIAAVRARDADIGVRLAGPPGGEALQFDCGFKVRPFFARLIEPAKARRAWLAEKRIDRQIVGTWPDIFAYGLPPLACQAWHRMLNDTLGEWCAEHAARFSWIASVPMPGAEAAAAELDRAVGRGAIGAIVAANVEGINLGEIALDALWAKAQALDVPILVHPVMSTPAPRAAKFALAQIAQYTFDTTLGVGSLLFSGTLDRFPGLTLVFSHGGGAFPYLMGRFDLMHERMDRAGQGDVAAKPPSAYAGRMATTPSSMRRNRCAFSPTRSGSTGWCSGPTTRSRPPTSTRWQASRPPASRPPTSQRSPTPIPAVCSSE
jgi:aminocarboxymuconate-semialdehyde decarboxylase